MQTLAAPDLPVPILPLAFEIVPHWAMNKWVIILCFLVAAALVIYLYRAQQKIASRRVIALLTGIRFALVLLTFALLAGLTLQWTRKNSTGGTLWLVVDQSGSMRQADPQATPAEKLRWADALGYLPADLRTSRLDRSAARLDSLRADFVYWGSVGELATSPDAKEAERQQEQFLKGLRDWNDKLTATADEIEKDPTAKGTDGSIVKNLRDVSQQLKTALDKAEDRKTRAEAAKDVAWGAIKTKLDSARAALRPLAEQADQKLLAEKGQDPKVTDALQKVSAHSRAELVALSLKAKHNNSAITDLIPRQTTRLVTFADGPQASEIRDASDLEKALKAAPATTAPSADGKSTDLAKPLNYILEQLGQDEPASVILLSDGRRNVGDDAEEPAKRLAARGVRVFTVALGTEQVAPDAAIEQIDAPDWIYKDDTLRGSVLLRLDGLEGKPVKVEFRRGETLLDAETKTVTPAVARDTKLVNFNDKPPEPGVFEYSVRVVPVENEAVKDNNAQTLRVSVKKDKLNVLMIEDQPRWEYRYLANYLERDQRVKLQTVLLQPANIFDDTNQIDRPALEPASPKNERTEASLPTKREQWAAFDFIVIGDVPKERLPQAAQENIVWAVRDRGATALLIAGLFNMPQRWGDTALQEILPVDLASDWSGDELERHRKEGFRAKIAPEGLTSVLSQFTVDEKQNAAFWAALPEWYWHSEQTHARSANVIWSIADSDKAPSSPEVNSAATSDPATAPAAGDDGNSDNTSLGEIRKKALLATMSVGNGRVMYLASDSTWRLRQVNGLNLHERFWGQVVRWVVGSELPAGGKYVRFGADRPRYVAGEPVVVRARLLNEEMAPLKDEDVRVVARLMPSRDPNTGKPTGEGKVVAETELVPDETSPGYYRAALGGLPEGAIELSLKGTKVQELFAKDESATSQNLNIDVLSQFDVEHRNINADPAVMRALAESGGGVSVGGAHAHVLATHVPKLEYVNPRTVEVGLFADPRNPNTKKTHWIFLAAFVVLASAEWIIRKSAGLV